MTTPVMDAHHHLWDLAQRDQEWTRATPTIHRSFLEEELIPLLGECGVDATVLVQTINSSAETEEFLALAANSSFIRGVVGWVDLASRNVDEEIAALRTLPGGERLVGVRHLVQDEPDPDWLRQPHIREGLRALGGAGITYDLLVRPPQWDTAIDTVRSLPNVRFVLDHCGKPPFGSEAMERWGAVMAELAALDNVVVKLSGLVSETAQFSRQVEDLRPYANVVLSNFGASRVLFGSDWPVCLLAATYGQVFDTAQELCNELNASEQECVFGGTAIDWYGLDVA
jgi:L-fuconolactonase